MRLIDADAIVKQMQENFCSHCDGYECQCCEACAYWDAMYFVKDAPTIEAEPVRNGRWVHNESIGLWNCSKCGGLVTDVETYYRYCQYCGAKMDQEDNP